MKNAIKQVLPMLIFFFAVNMLSAQEKARHERAEHAKENFEKMKAELGLSEQQEADIKQLYKERNQKLKESRPAREEMETMSEEDKKAKKIEQMKLRKELAQDMDTKMASILDKEQFEKYKAMKAEKKEEMKGRRAEHRMMKHGHEHKEGEEHHH